MIAGLSGAGYVVRQGEGEEDARTAGMADRVEIVARSVADEAIVLVAMGREGEQVNELESRLFEAMKALWEGGKRFAGEYIIGMATQGGESIQGNSWFVCANAQTKYGSFRVTRVVGASLFPSASAVIDSTWSLRHIPGVSTLSMHDRCEVATVPISLLEHLDVDASFQRHYSPVHMAEIRDSFAQGDARIHRAMGVIQIAYCGRKYYIIDGQHRFHAYIDYWRTYGTSFVVALQVTRLGERKELESLYETHYKAWDATKTEKQNANIGADWAYRLANELLDLVGERFHTPSGATVLSDNSKAPYISRNTYKTDLIAMFNDDEAAWRDKTASNLLELVVERNNAMRSHIPKTHKHNARKQYAAATLAKAEQWNCFLGLVSAHHWLK